MKERSESGDLVWSPSSPRPVSPHPATPRHASPHPTTPHYIPAHPTSRHSPLHRQLAWRPAIVQQPPAPPDGLESEVGVVGSWYRRAAVRRSPAKIRRGFRSPFGSVQASSCRTRLGRGVNPPATPRHTPSADLTRTLRAAPRTQAYGYGSDQ